MNAKTWLVLGAILGGLSVTFGAFGAHWLREALAQWISDETLRARRLDNWEVAARYQMYHALALLAVGLLAAQRSDWVTTAAGLCFVFGTLIFCGLLYGLVLSYAAAPEGWTWMGAPVFIGGLLMIAGWIFLAIAAWRSFG